MNSPFDSKCCVSKTFCSFQHYLQVSKVRSITMDAWQHSEILAMLEGGNKQLGDFFDRHDLPSQIGCLSNSSSNNNGPINRYKTNAAKFYKKNLSLHVTQVKQSGVYQGREISRKASPQKQPEKRRRRCDDTNVNPNPHTLDSSSTCSSHECEQTTSSTCSSSSRSSSICSAKESV